MNPWIDNDWYENRASDDKPTLVTGTTGFIGSRYLDLYGVNVKTLNKEESHLIYKRNFDLMAKRDNLDTIVHIGAISDNQCTNLDLLNTWNFYATCTLVNYIKRVKGYMVYISSASAINPITDYGVSKMRAEQYIINNLDPEQYCILRPFNIYGEGEKKKLYGTRSLPYLLKYENPITDYGVSKMRAEQYIINNLDPEQYCILRPFNIYGEGEKKKLYGTRSLPYMLKYEKPNQVWDTERDYVYVDDVCDLINSCVTEKLSGIYEVGRAQTISARDLVGACSHIDPSEVNIIETPEHITRVSRSNRRNWVPGWYPWVSVLVWMHGGYNEKS